MQIRKQFAFEAAHVLPHHTGKCSRLHGHSYRLDVTIEGPLQDDGPATGMVVDFDELSRIVRAGIIEPLDHRFLNDIIENPTSENLARWLWLRLKPELPALSSIVVKETCTSGCIYTGE